MTLNTENLHVVPDELETDIAVYTELLALFSNIAKTTTVKIPENYEIVIEATGNKCGISQAMELVRKNGTIVLKSTYADNTEINLSMVPVNELKIVGSRCGPFEPALKALVDKSIILPKIVKYNLYEYNEAFSYLGFKAGFFMM